MLSTLFLGCLPASRAAVASRPGMLLVQEGDASYYADAFEGRRTASGETFSQSERTAAHRTYPFGTILRVTNLKSGQSTEVRVNDRGPFKETRVLDVSRRAAEEIGLTRDGVARVRIEVLAWGDPGS
ncbi:MAG TPA: septal ring lytic transglycosylase RlpA family protein [Candidatus Kapabacteria bacterium]|nr:septal ring lytic transglycosylase RlpA family protein [Candidatus Kapabacteria bacterium]